MKQFTLVMCKKVLLLVCVLVIVGGAGLVKPAAHTEGSGAGAGSGGDRGGGDDSKRLGLLDRFFGCCRKHAAKKLKPDPEELAAINSIAGLSDSDRKDLLIKAADKGWLSCVQHLITPIPKDQRAAFIAGDRRIGQTALHRAVVNNHNEVIEFLINAPPQDQCCAFINIVDIYSQTALHYAAITGRIYTFAQLLSQPCIDITIQNDRRQSARDINPELFDVAVKKANEIIEKRNAKARTIQIKAIQDTVPFPPGIADLITRYAEHEFIPIGASAAPAHDLAELPDLAVFVDLTV